MQAKDFQPDDLFAQIQALVGGLEAERQARKTVEASDAAKSELLALIGRELRPPMQAVVTMSEHLLASPLNASQRRYTETLAQSGRSLLSVLSDVLDFSELEAGEAEFESTPLDLHALVGSVASEFHARASAKGLTSGVNLAANCPRFIIGDEVRLRQVIMSLVEAALRSTSAGIIRLYVSVNDAEAPLSIRFDITDTGDGLTKAEQERLFVRASADLLAAGSGLDLPIAERLATAMDGEVGCESALGQGTLYWFKFRAERAEGEAETLDRQGNAATPKGALSGHVLVVEDNMINRMLIGAYLDEFGLTYEMVENGAAAIMCLAVRTYDLVLMDTVLPDYDGLQIADRIRSLHAPSAAVPIVALVPHDATDADNDYVAAGMNGFVAKPIEGRTLYAALVPFLTVPSHREALAIARR